MKNKSFFQIFRESNHHLIGTCVKVGDENYEITRYFSDATELAQDLGYYSTFDDFEDPDDSNWMTISSHDFAESCNYTLPKHHFIFLRRKEEPFIYCAYDEDTDIHHFYY